VAQDSTFGKIQHGGGRHLENTQAGVSWPILDRFAPNLVSGFIFATQRLPEAQNTCSPRWKFKMVAAVILDFVFGHISVANKDRVKFGKWIDIGQMRDTVAQHAISVKFKMAAAAITKTQKQVYLGQLSTDLHQICCTGLHWLYDSYQMQK